MRRRRGPESSSETIDPNRMSAEALGLQFEILKGNAANFQVTERQIRRAFQTTYLMNVTLFLVGIAAFGGAVVKGFTAHGPSDVAASGVFGGLSVASFVSAFIFRPLESIEQDSIYITWLLSVFNTYLYRLVYFNNQETIDADLCRAEANLVARLKDLAESHAANAAKYGATRRPVIRRRRAARSAPPSPPVMASAAGTIGDRAMERAEPASVDGSDGKEG